MCLANRFSTKVPSAKEKHILEKCGLGYKKVKLSLNDNEESVYKKLSNAGGFNALQIFAT